MLLLNCSIVDELTKFDIDYQTSYSIAPTTLINSPFNIFTPDVTTESESTFENNNTRTDLIESIKLKNIKLTIESPEDGNFNFLKEIHVYIEAEDVDEVERKLAWQALNDPSFVNFIQIKQSSQNLLQQNALLEKLGVQLSKISSNSSSIKTTNLFTGMLAARNLGEGLAEGFGGGDE